MTSQQDTELNDTQDLELETILYAMAEDLKRGFVHSSVITTKQALTSWKDKEVRLARIDELSKISGFSNATGVATLAGGKLQSIDDRIRTLKESAEAEQSIK